MDIHEMNIGIYGFNNGQQNTLERITAPGKTEYALMHGYTNTIIRELDKSLPSAYCQKIGVAIKHLRDHDWFVWMDLDQYIISKDIPIETYLNPNKILIIQKDNPNVNERNNFKPNNSLVIIRNCDLAMYFLQEWEKLCKIKGSYMCSPSFWELTGYDNGKPANSVRKTMWTEHIDVLGFATIWCTTTTVDRSCLSMHTAGGSRPEKERKFHELIDSLRRESK
jgi:hypothetical protein